MKGIHRLACMLGLAALLSSCATSNEDGARFTDANACFAACDRANDRCLARSHSLSQCESDSKMGGQDCDAIGDAGLRAACRSRVVDCATRNPAQSCSESNARCLQGCGQ